MMATHTVFSKGSVEWPFNWLYLRISPLAHDGGLCRTDHNDKVSNIVIGMSDALQQIVPNKNRQSCGLKQTIQGLSRSPGEDNGQS